jgi:predicted metal-dependent phosphoesterase TrpH
VIVELHCHSHCSDGTEPPGEVARKAAGAGVEIFCLTDHDTWAGFADTADTAASAGGMRVLRGMELSCDERGRSIHVLLLGLEEGPGLDRLATEVADLQRRRRERIVEICARFRRWNIELQPEAVFAQAGEGVPGRPHVAAALMKAGVVRTVREAFDRFLRDGGPADVPGPRLPVVRGVELGRQAGARVSLAHPHSAGSPENARPLLERAREAGLGGIEAFYGPYTRQEQAPWIALADAMGLVATAGSDYHGPVMTPDIPRPGSALSADRADRLRTWLLTDT